MIVFMVRVGALFFARISAVLLTCASLSVSAADWQSFNGGRWRPLTPEGGATGFCLLDPASIGLLFTNELSESRAATNRTLYNGSGVATGDIDGDGRIDLVFAGIENRLEVFRNLGNWTFTNATRASGLVITNLVCRGVVLADIDGDSALDLLVAANNRGVLCWRNDGRGVFTEVTREAGTGSPFGSVTMTFADVDGNGSLDLYIANNRSDDIRDRG